MNRTQGGTRSLPDGFLHIQNFTVTKDSGIASAVWKHAMDERQRTLVEWVLIEMAGANILNVHRFKHGCWRFKKEFLQVNFEWAVFKVCQVLRKDPAQDLYDTVLRRDRLINKD
jgi:hypothetical protein